MARHGEEEGMHAATHLTPVSNTRLWARRIMHAHLPEGEKMDVSFMYGAIPSCASSPRPKASTIPARPPDINQTDISGGLCSRTSRHWRTPWMSWSDISAWRQG